VREISEDEAWAMAGDAEPDLLAKVENDETESAVALKRFAGVWVLGISCDTQDRFTLYAFDTEQEAWAAYDRHAAQMQSRGTPYFE
jgi:hypothetical protein